MIANGSCTKLLCDFPMLLVGDLSEFSTLNAYPPFFMVHHRFS